MNQIDYWYQKYLKEKLTWEDIDIIQDAINETHSEYPCGLSAECFGNEVIRKFYERRK